MMIALNESRLHLRRELEAPPALRRFGSGGISGVLGLGLWGAGLLLVVAIYFPRLLAMPQTRPLQQNGWFRLGLHGMLIAAFASSLLSLVLRRGKMLGTTGAVAVLLASFIGGSHSSAVVADSAPVFVGLDWFVLNVLFTGLLFI